MSVRFDLFLDFLLDAVEFHPHITGKKSCAAAHKLLKRAGYRLVQDAGWKSKKRGLFLYEKI